MSKHILGIFLALFAGYAMADVYSWTDDQGITHYGENVPSQYAKKARNLSGKKDVDKLTAEKKPMRISRKNSASNVRTRKTAKPPRKKSRKKPTNSPLKFLPVKRPKP